MIPVIDIVRLVRFKEKDNDELKFSDYDILNCLNEALRYIGQSNALMNSDFLEKTVVYEDNGNFGICSMGGFKLPDDFVVLVGVSNMEGRKLRPTEITNIPEPTEYKITNDRIYCGTNKFIMAYKRSLDDVTGFDDEIDLPRFMLDIITKTTCLILEQAETDTMMQSVDDMARAIVPRRRYIGAETKMPFFC